MKLFRYRRTSLGTVFGTTKLKKQTNKKLGITAAMKPFRAKTNIERKLKRSVGYYSEPAKALRHASTSTSKPRKKASANPSKVKIVRVNYGLFGNPNLRGIQRAIQKWTRKGYRLKQQINQKGRWFSFGYTLLMFVE